MTSLVLVILAILVLSNIRAWIKTWEVAGFRIEADAVDWCFMIGLYSAINPATITIYLGCLALTISRPI